MGYRFVGSILHASAIRHVFTPTHTNVGTDASGYNMACHCAQQTDLYRHVVRIRRRISISPTRCTRNGSNRGRIFRLWTRCTFRRTWKKSLHQPFLPKCFISYVNYANMLSNNLHHENAREFRKRLPSVAENFPFSH